MSLISRRLFNPDADLSNPQQRSKWMMDLSMMLDDIVGALNSPGPTTQVSAAPYPGAVTTRALNTVYQNTTGKPMKVSVGVQINAASGYIQAVTDANSSPTVEIDLFQAYTANAFGGVSFDVLPNNYYKINNPAGVASLLHWIETY